MQENEIFRGLKVVELASVLAGPLVGTFFAELGAEVIKIENPATGGDITRQWKLGSEPADADYSAYYLAANRGKNSIFLDLANDSDREKLLQLLAGADILITNFKPGDEKKFRLSYSDLQEKFPRLVCLAISGYGENDPRPAFDLVLQAETGFMSMNGTAESGPLKMPVALIDVLAAHQAKEGVLTALYKRCMDGKGSRVTVSLYDSALSSLANQATNYLVAGHTPQLSGSLHPNIAPYGETFRCADGRYLVLAVGTDRQFEKLCLLLDQAELARDPRFAANQERVKHRNELAAVLAPAFYLKNAAEMSEKLQADGIPCSSIKTVAEALENPAAAQLIVPNREGKSLRTAVFTVENPVETDSHGFE